MNLTFYIFAICCLFAIESEARLLILARNRRVGFLQHLNSLQPVETVAFTRLDTAITALPSGQEIETDPSPSELVSELIALRVNCDLPGFRGTLTQTAALTRQEAFHLYKDTLISAALDFKSEVLAICKPISISPWLLRFALRQLNFLEQILEDFHDERGRLEVLLLEGAMFYVIDEAGFNELLQHCDINAPLSNEFPLIFHVIFHSLLPEYFLDKTLSHPHLDLFRTSVEGAIDAPWQDLPLLTHAWIYSERAFTQLHERIPVTAMIPTIKQTLNFLF